MQLSLSSLSFRLKNLVSQIWTKVTAYTLLSVLTALLAMWLRPFIPSDLALQIGAESAETILEVVATSMLTVATFSMGIMASAIAGAADGATPRATELLLEDRVSQNALATFLGAFAFSLVGIIGLTMGFYEEGGRVILFGMTLVVIFLIFVAFIRWINALRSFGRIPDTLSRIETAVEHSLNCRLRDPYLSCNPLHSMPATDGMRALPPPCSGFVRHIDLISLQRLAEEHDLRIWIDRPPGRFTSVVRPLAFVSTPGGLPDAALIRALAKCFTVGPVRSFEQDPQFGMIVFAETASRALSPAVNDPGTAIDVLRRAIAILQDWDTPEEPGIIHHRIWMPGLCPEAFLTDLIRPIARDGAQMVEVHHVILSLLRDLARARPEVFAAPARRHAKEALARAEDALVLDSERQELRRIAEAFG